MALPCDEKSPRISGRNQPYWGLITLQGVSDPIVIGCVVLEVEFLMQELNVCGAKLNGTTLVAESSRHASAEHHTAREWADLAPLPARCTPRHGRQIDVVMDEAVLQLSWSSRPVRVALANRIRCALGWIWGSSRGWHARKGSYAGYTWVLPCTSWLCGVCCWALVSLDCS